MRLVWATVAEVTDSHADVQRLAVELDDGSEGTALAYRCLTGECSSGDRVLLNATAIDLRLGTGGLYFVAATPGSGRGTVLDERSGGHIMKLRYTPLQLDVLSVEEPASPYHQVMSEALSLEGMPVACCGLHSQVPLVAMAAKARGADLRIAYVMTDGAALPLALSDIARSASAEGLLDATITCGQAFGGTHEAVNLYSGLLAARHVVEADIAIVAIGPGVVGTATAFGHGGVDQGEAMNAVASLGGTAVAAIRASGVDARDRHRGASHHTLVALTRVALAPARVALPASDVPGVGQIDADLREAGVWGLHVRAETEAGRDDPGERSSLEVRTMGRGPQEDPIFFACAYAAGEECARIAVERRSEPA